MTTEILWADIAVKEAQLDALQPVSRDTLCALQKAFDVDLTYTSNAIEGNTLTLRDTAEAIEHGIAVGGKSLRDHLEAVDHYNAVLWMREMAGQKTPAGRKYRLRTAPAHCLPQPARHRGHLQHPPAPEPAESFRAHYDLVASHPFSDGNGRTARFLMNLLLLSAGYPPWLFGRRSANAILTHWNMLPSPKISIPSRPSYMSNSMPRLGEYVSALQEAQPDPQSCTPASAPKPS